MRKHFNTIDRAKLDECAFFCWECISIETAHRNIDLVIQNEKEMRMLLKFLIQAIETIDGVKGSACKLINWIVNKRLGRFQNSLRKIKEEVLVSLEQKVE